MTAAVTIPVRAAGAADDCQLRVELVEPVEANVAGPPSKSVLRRLLPRSRAAAPAVAVEMNVSSSRHLDREPDTASRRYTNNSSHIVNVAPVQDSPGTTDLRPSRPISRRDTLRYVAAASALAGLGAAAAGGGAPAASAAAPTLIDFAMRQVAARDIRAAGHSGVINYVSTSRPGSSFGAKPITLPYASH